jgi:putative ABC transport system permease protein
MMVGKLADLLRISLRQLLHQRRRYLGVVLAVALSTAGFVVTYSSGREVKGNLNRDLDLLGGATVVKAYFEGRSHVRWQWFRSETCDALRALPGVSNLSRVAVKFSASANVGTRQQVFTLVAADGNFWAVNGFSAFSGSLFDRESVDDRELVCVLGEGLARKLFGTVDGVGRWLRIERDLYQVGGVLGGATVGDRTHFAFIPLSTAVNRIAGLSFPNRLYVRCRTWDDVAAVAAAIPAVVRNHQPDAGLTVEVAWEALQRVQKAAWWVEVFIYTATGATFVLGGFGIWNGMMASVRARVREIGLKKALGAEDGDILIQFLAEALWLSVCSALLGVLMGRILVEITGWLLRQRLPESDFWVAAGIGLISAVFLGVAAGLYPAVRASRMEVVTALRSE